MKTRKGPYITVIVAVLNNADTIGRCLESIENQTYPFIETIVIDGGSRDGALEKIREHRGLIAYLESKPDNGIFHAWNKALKRMTGDWACFLGADDYFWENDALERAVPWLKKALPEHPVVYANAVGVLDDRVVEFRGGPWNRKRFFDTMYMSHQSVIHHRGLFEKFGLFDQTYKSAGDYDFLLRCLAREDALYIPDLILSAYTVCGVSNRIESADIVPAEAARARRANGAKNLSLPLIRHFLLCKSWKIAAKILGRKKANRIADLYRLSIGKTPMYFKGDRGIDETDGKLS